MKKGLIYSVIILCVLFLLASLLVPNYLEKKLQPALEAQVITQTDSSYVMKFKQLNISFWSKKVSADSISILPNKENEAIKSILIKNFEIQGIKWLSLLTDDFPSFKKVVVEYPEIEVYSRPITPTTFSGASTTKTTPKDSLFSDFDVQITGGKAKIIDSSGRMKAVIGNFSLSATKINANQLLDGTRLPFIDELTLSGSDLTWQIDDKFYRLEIGDFKFNRADGLAFIKDMALIPELPRYRFTEIKGYSIDRYELNIDKINLQGVDLDSLFISKIKIKTAAIEKGELSVFKDKTIPPRSAIMYKPLLSEVVRKASKFQYGVGEVLINNFDVTYIEHKEGAKEPDQVSFQNITGSIQNIATPGYPGFFTDSLLFDVTTLFMGVSKLEVHSRYALFDESENHRVWGSLGAIETSTINPTLIHLANMEAKSGKVNSLDFKFKINREGANGTINLDYENLDVSLLSDFDTTNTSVGKQIATFITNTFIVKSNNTGADFKPGKIDYTWNKQKSIFGYWWHSLLTGIKDSIK